MFEILPFSAEYIQQAIDLWGRSEGVSLGLADSPEEIRKYLSRNSDMSFIAKRDGTFVGAILGGHDARRGYLHHLAVEPAHRHLGIGRALVDHCLTALKKEGIERTHVFVRADNEIGRGFWRREGWKERNDLVMYSFTEKL